MEKYPLQWPGGWKRTKSPERSRFGKWNDKPSIAKATNFLLHELNLFGVTNCIISTNLKYKIDNTPYSNQREPDDKGVAIYFKYQGQDMAIACDSFDKVGCNIYAIGKTIEAMRGIERWGCSELLNKAFTGFKALPESASVTKENWWDILCCYQNASEEYIKACYRHLAKKYHPDTGAVKNSDMFIKVNQAYETAMKQFEPA
jgi:hypothetical protein